MVPALSRGATASDGPRRDVPRPRSHGTRAAAVAARRLHRPGRRRRARHRRLEPVLARDQAARRSARSGPGIRHDDRSRHRLRPGHDAERPPGRPGRRHRAPAPRPGRRAGPDRTAAQPAGADAGKRRLLGDRGDAPAPHPDAGRRRAAARPVRDAGPARGGGPEASRWSGPAPAGGSPPSSARSRRWRRPCPATGAAICTGFVTLEARPVRVDGWLCAPLGQPPEPRALACALDGLALDGRADPATDAVFAEAEARRDPACDPIRALSAQEPAGRTGSIAPRRTTPPQKRPRA